MSWAYRSVGKVLTQHAQGPGGWSPVPHQTGVMVYACNPSTWEIKANGSEVQGYFCYIVSSWPTWDLLDPVLKEKEKLGSFSE